MAIFEAEHRKKTAPEDQLTSRVFGSLSVLDKRKVLIPFMKKLLEDDPLLQNKQPNNISNYLDMLSNEDIRMLNLGLWKCFGRTYPDVFVDIPGETKIVIEVKEMSKSNPEQIVEQCNDVRKTVSSFIYFLLTNDEHQPKSILQAVKKLKKQNVEVEIYWRKWKQVWKWLNDIGKNKDVIGTTDGELIKDMTRLLGDKGMRHNTGVKDEWFTEEVSKSVEKLNALYKELQLIVLDLRADLDKLDLKEDGTGFFYFQAPNPKKLSGDQELIPQWIDIQYRDRKWRKSVLKNAYIYIGVDFLASEFFVGFYIWDRSDEDIEKLKTAASKKGFSYWLEPPEKGKKAIIIYHTLIGGISDVGESKIVTLKEIKSSLKRVRDFVRGFYEIRDNGKSVVSKKR